MERPSTLTVVCQRISETSVVTAVKADFFFFHELLQVRPWNRTGSVLNVVWTSGELQLRMGDG